MKKHPEHVNIQIVMKKENVFIIAQNIIRLFALLVIQIYAAQHRLHLTAPSLRENRSRPRPSVLKVARQVKHNR